jgi:thiamine biosynthesis lipoprotein
LYKYFAVPAMRPNESSFISGKSLLSRPGLLAAAVALLLCACNGPGRYVAVTGYAQGGTYSVKFNTSGVRVPRAEIASAIDSILILVDTTLSGYNKSSQLSRFNAGEVIMPNQLFSDIYAFSRDIWEETGGCVDVAAGPLFDIWGFGFSNDSLPSPDKVCSVLEECGMARLRGAIAPGEPLAAASLLTVSSAIPPAPSTSSVIPSTSSVIPSTSSVIPSTSSVIPSEAKESALPRLNFNAIAQGYTCDMVAGYLRSIGVTDMLVDIGEIYCAGRNPSGRDWNIGVDRPTDGNDTPGADLDGVWYSAGRSCGIVTSGNYRKFYVRDGRKIAHTVDPRTGYPVDHSLLSATIVAPSAAAADAYATYCMVLGFEQARAFIEGRPDLEGYLIRDVDGTMTEWASPGFTLR